VAGNAAGGVRVGVVAPAVGGVLPGRPPDIVCKQAQKTVVRRIGEWSKSTSTYLLVGTLTVKLWHHMTGLI